MPVEHTSMACGKNFAESLRSEIRELITVFLNSVEFAEAGEKSGRQRNALADSVKHTITKWLI